MGKQSEKARRGGGLHRRFYRALYFAGRLPARFDKRYSDDVRDYRCSYKPFNIYRDSLSVNQKLTRRFFVKNDFDFLLRGGACKWAVLIKGITLGSFPNTVGRPMIAP